MTQDIKDQIHLHRQRGEWAQVIQLAENICETEPEDLFALKCLADGYDRTNQSHKALEIWRKLVDCHHEVNPYARKLGLKLKAQDDPAAQNYLEQALSMAIEKKSLHDVEEIWIELVDLKPAKPATFIEFAQRLANRNEKSRAGELLLIFVESASLQPTDRLECMRVIVENLPERQDSFRDTLLQSYRDVFSDRPDLEKLITLANLSKSESLLQSMIELDRYLKFGEGQYFHHHGWGAGKVSRIDPALQRVYIDFTRKKDHQLTLEMADKSLTPIQPNDLRALRLENEKALIEMAVSRPVEIIKAALISCGGKANAKELKEALLNQPIKESDWAKWWSSVSKALKDDHYIEVSGGSLKTFSLRQMAETPDEEYARRFRECRTIRGRIDMITNYQAHLGKSCDPVILGQMVSDIVSMAQKSKEDAESIEAVFLAQSLEETVPTNTAQLMAILDPILDGLERSVSALEKLRSVSLQSRWFALMEERLGDKLSSACERLLNDGPDSLRDLVAFHMNENQKGPMIESLFKKTRPAYKDRSSLFIWFARRYMASRQVAEAAGITRPALLDLLISLHEILTYRVKTHKKDDSKELRSQMADIRHIIKKGNLKVLKEVLTELDSSTARQLRKTVEKSISLEDSLRNMIATHIITNFKDSQPIIVEESELPLAGLALPAGLLCLFDTLEAKQQQLKNLREVEIPQNSKDIDTARRLGDLKENAEYHAAKERQGILLAMKDNLEGELGRAMAVGEKEFRTDLAAFGSQVMIRYGEDERCLILLGPWESDPDKNIISYESPLGSLIWGRRVGDVLPFNHAGRPTTVEILSIETWSPDEADNTAGNPA